MLTAEFLWNTRSRKAIFLDVFDGADIERELVEVTKALGGAALELATDEADVERLWHVRRGNIRGHRMAMLGLYIGGLLIAGGLTLLPGRVLHRVVFG